MTEIIGPLTIKNSLFTTIKEDLPTLLCCLYCLHAVICILLLLHQASTPPPPCHLFKRLRSLCSPTVTFIPSFFIIFLRLGLQNLIGMILMSLWHFESNLLSIVVEYRVTPLTFLWEKFVRVAFCLWTVRQLLSLMLKLSHLSYPRMWLLEALLVAAPRNAMGEPKKINFSNHWIPSYHSW